MTSMGGKPVSGSDEEIEVKGQGGGKAADDGEAVEGGGDTRMEGGGDTRIQGGGDTRITE